MRVRFPALKPKDSDPANQRPAAATSGRRARDTTTEPGVHIPHDRSIASTPPTGAPIQRRANDPTGKLTRVRVPNVVETPVPKQRDPRRD